MVKFEAFLVDSIFFTPIFKILVRYLLQSKIRVYSLPFFVVCFEKFFQEYDQSVKQFGSRSGPTFCRA